LDANGGTHPFFRLGVIDVKPYQPIKQGLGKKSEDTEGEVPGFVAEILSHDISPLLNVNTNILHGFIEEINRY